MNNKPVSDSAYMMAQIIVNDKELYHACIDTPISMSIENAVLDYIDAHTKIHPNASRLVYMMLGVAAYHMDWDEVRRLIRL